MFVISDSHTSLSDMGGAPLQIKGKSSFIQCRLSGCQISGDLSQAAICGSTLHRTDFREATLAGVDLTCSIYTEETLWPEGFDPEGAGAILATPKLRQLFGIPESPTTKANS